MTSNHETSTYNIAKYSRQITQSNADTHNTSNGGEWEHRSGSGLRLLLERTLMDDGIRNRLILHVIQDSSSTFELTSRSNTLEEVDITALQSVRLNSALPLKVVFQETRVGFRYLYQSDGPKKSVFRRFQVTFVALSDASVFIQAIQSSCVCTPARGNGNQKPASMLPPPVVPTTACSPLFPSTATNQQAIPGKSTIQTYERSSENAMFYPSIIPSVQETASSTIIRTDSGPVLAHAPFAQPLQLYHNLPLVHSVYPPESQMLLPPTAQTQASHLPVQTLNVALHSIPHGSEYSPPASALRPAASSDVRGPSSTPPIPPATDPIGSIIVSVAKLYQLPVEELESAVADILREPGLEEFIGRLDKIWALHGFMRR